MAATSVMSDRICIHSHGSSQPSISAQDLIECCNHCGGYLYQFIYFLKTEKI